MADNGGLVRKKSSMRSLTSNTTANNIINKRMKKKVPRNFLMIYLSSFFNFYLFRAFGTHPFLATDYTDYTDFEAQL